MDAPSCIVLRPDGTPFVRLLSPFAGRYELHAERRQASTDPMARVTRDTVQSLGSSNDSTPTLDRVRAVGAGQYGAVVRATAVTTGFERAIKLLDYDRAEAAGLDSLEWEMTWAGQRVFKHLLPVLDYSRQERDLDGVTFAYLVWQFVDGSTLGDFLEQLSGEWQQILGNERFRRRVHDILLVILSDILGGLVELHSSDVAHIDLKPTNILVYPRLAAAANSEERFAASYRAAVIDLGASKPIGHRSRSSHHAYVRLVHSRRYFPNALLPLMDSQPDPVRGGNRYLLKDVAAFGQFIDLYCLGRTLEEALVVRPSSWGMDDSEISSDVPKEAFWREIYRDDFDVLSAFIAELTVDPAKTSRARLVAASSAETKARFDTIPLHSSHGVFASDALMDRSPGLQIRVGDTLVRLTHPFDSIVDHAQFQRLRHIQQLALVSHVFPDGTHTRFAHSLRTFRLAKQVVLALARNSRFRSLFGPKDIDQLLAASLLHDIGQYPFSHCLEDLKKMAVRTEKRLVTEEAGDARMRRSPDPEQIASRRHRRAQERELLTGLGDIPHDQERFLDRVGIPDIISKRDVTIATLLEAHGLNVEDIEYLVQKKVHDHSRRPSLNISRDIINGLIDVDRITYLVHDSSRTGVPYGAAIDVEALIDGLTLRADVSDAGLAIEARAVGEAEAVLMAVHWMYRHVYWRHTNRAIMAALKFVTARLIRTGRLKIISDYVGGLDEHGRMTIGVRSDAEALELLFRGFEDIRGNEGRNPLAALVNDRRIGYRRVYSLGWENDPHVAVYDAVVSGISPLREKKLVDAIAEALTGQRTVADGDILIDVPLKPRLSHKERALPESTDEPARHGQLWVAVRDRLSRKFLDWKELREWSRLAGLLEDLEDQSGRKIRVFFSRELLSDIASTAPALYRGLDHIISDVLRQEVERWPRDA